MFPTILITDSAEKETTYYEGSKMMTTLCYVI